MRHLVMDGQIFHTPAWHRGMGKYAIELIRGIVKENTYQPYALTVVLSDQMEIDAELLQELQRSKNMTVVRLPLRPNNPPRTQEIAAHNRHIINDFMETLQGERTFFLMSLMQSEINPVFPSIPEIKNVLLVYDLIPYAYHPVYLRSEAVQQEYLSKFGEFARAHHYATISKTVANDLVAYLGIEPSNIATIDGGPISHDKKQQKATVPHPFILMPTGNDVRKNNRRGIEAFKQFNEKHNGKYTLVITSYFTEEEKWELSNLAPNVIFSGNVSGAELSYLYAKAEAVLFPAEYEGLGMPVLEAISLGTTVACSDISVFREISPDLFAYFDPYNTHDMAEALEKAVHSKVDGKKVKKILQKYDWQLTARKLLDLLGKKMVPHGATRPLSVIAGDISAEGAAGKLLLQMHVELAKQCRPNYYYAETDGYKARLNYLPYVTQAQSLIEHPVIPESLPRLYHITDTTAGAQALFIALARPGVVVLHDASLEMPWQALHETGMISRSRFVAEKQLLKRYKLPPEVEYLVSLVERQKAVIVFSQELYNLLVKIKKQTHSDVMLAQIPLPVNGPVYGEVMQETKQYGISTEDIWTGTIDMEYERTLSRARTVQAATETDLNDLLPGIEASKYTPSVKGVSYQQFVSQLLTIIAESEEKKV